MILYSVKSYKNSHYDNFVNIEATDMKHIPFESSHRDESNGVMIIEIQSLDVEIIRADYKNSHYGNFVNIDDTDMKYLPFEFLH